jgi:hypothetical protein
MRRIVFAERRARSNIRQARYFILQLAAGHLTWSLFRQILGRIERLAWHPERRRGGVFGRLVAAVTEARRTTSEIPVQARGGTS